MTGTTPNLNDFNLEEIVRRRDRAEESGLEEDGFEGNTYPHVFIHDDVTVAWTEYASYPGSIGFLEDAGR